MPTYRELFDVPEFRVLFANRLVVMAAVATSGLALGTITYEATGSAGILPPPIVEIRAADARHCNPNKDRAWLQLGHWELS